MAESVAESSSSLHAVGTPVWYRKDDKDHPWIEGQVTRLQGDQIVVQTADGEEHACSGANAPLRNAGPVVEDLVQLNHLNEPALLHNLRARYELDDIYTYTGQILIAVNPFQPMPHLYGGDMMECYAAADHQGELSPHVYAIADTSYKQMRANGRSQAILVSGESGAGKTETSKHIMQYLVESSPIENDHNIEEKILESNPLLEAFGNAKTVRNDNSSRFGKFTEIQFDARGSICGAAIKTYLLERSRVVSVSDPERNYHVFYQLCDGATAEEREAWNLKDARDFRYLSTSSCFELDGCSNAEEYVKTRQAMDIVGIPTETQESVFKAVAAVLHLGNVTFEAVDDDECKVSTASTAEASLADTARLLGVPVDGLRTILTTRTRRTPDGKIVSPINVDAANNTRDAFAKTLYSRTFDWLVECINKSIGQDPNPSSVIGVLDIYGFEEFKRNDFEQFCINFANEKLQQHFNAHVFKMEQKEYEEEGIEWSYIEFVDNQDVLDVIEGCGAQRARHAGVLDLLDESCKFPRATNSDFAQKLYSSDFISKSSRFSKPKLARDEFVIQHYAGDVQYDTLNFLEKNKDFVVLEHQELLGDSTEAFVRGLYPADQESSTSSSSSSGVQSSFKFSSVSSRFSKQLNELMSTLHDMEPHYIRCIKPNKSSVPMEFEVPGVLQQLRCGGVLEAVRISCAGYPSKRTYEEFCDHFWMMFLDVSNDPNGFSGPNRAPNARQMTQAIIERSLTHRDTQFGKSRVFLRAGRMAELEKKRMELQNSSATLIQAHIKSWLARRKFQETVSSVLRIQGNWRSFKAREELHHRRSERAALRIQTAYRSFAARKRLLAVFDAVHVIQRTYRLYVENKALAAQRRESAATLIQSSWRTCVARREFEEIVRAVVLAQSLWRARLARAEVSRRRVAARESGKLMQDKENLEKKVLNLQELSENLKNQRNELRKQLKQEKADRAEVEVLMQGELEVARADVVRSKDEIAAAAKSAAETAARHQGELSKALEELDAQRAATAEELAASKALVAAHETKIRELEARIEEMQNVSGDRVANLEAQLRIALVERDNAMEEAQIAAGRLGAGPVALGGSRSPRSPGAPGAPGAPGERGIGSPRNSSGHLVARRSSLDREDVLGQRSSTGVSDMDRKQRELVARQQQLLREQRVADQERLISALKVDLGFHQGNPVAAVVVFRSFVHWKAIQQEKGAIFERVSEAIGMQIESFQEDNDRLGYWFTNTAALYYLMQRHTKPSANENGITARLRISGQQAAKGLLSYFRSPGRPDGGAGAGASGSPSPSGANAVPASYVQFEARYAALLFKQGLGALVQTIFPRLRDNFKREISGLLILCMNATAAGHRGKKSPWKEMVDVLDELLAILKANHVPHVLASKLFEDLFAIVDVFLFNQLMLKRDCCSFSNGEYAKLGLHEVEKWTVAAGEEWVGNSLHNLSHLRQAVTFLVIHQKAQKTLDEIRKDLCPSLSVQQIYRLSTMYWDDRFNTQSVSNDVLTQLKALMSGGHHFLLSEDSAIPFSTEDLGTLYDGKNLLGTLDNDTVEALAPLLLGAEDSSRSDKLEYLTTSLAGAAPAGTVSPIKMQSLA